MSEKGSRMLEELVKILPKLPDSKKHELLGYGLALKDMQVQREKEDKKPSELVAE